MPDPRDDDSCDGCGHARDSHGGEGPACFVTIKRACECCFDRCECQAFPEPRP